MKRTLLLSLALVTAAFAQTPAPAPAPGPGPRPAPPAFEKGEAPAKDGDPSPFAESDPTLPRQIQVTVEFIEVTQAEATRMLYKDKISKEGDKLRTELQRLVDEGKGTMFETMAITARSGQKATVESIREVIYPTEYEPATVPEQVSVDKDTAASPEKLKTLEALMTPATPTAFETRNTGNTLEVEPTLGEDSRTVDLRFVPEMVFDTGTRIYHQRKDSLGNESKIEMPLFYSMRLNTSLTLTDGQSQLAAVLSPKSAEGILDTSKKVFVIVRADVITVKPKK